MYNLLPSTDGRLALIVSLEESRSFCVVFYPLYPTTQHQAISDVGSSLQLLLKSEASEVVEALFTGIQLLLIISNYIVSHPLCQFLLFSVVCFLH